MHNPQDICRAMTRSAVPSAIFVQFRFSRDLFATPRRDQG